MKVTYYLKQQFNILGKCERSLTYLEWDDKTDITVTSAKWLT